MYLTLMLLVVASGPLIYVFIALSAKRTDTYELFHYAGRRVPPSEFVSTTVAYGLQVAVFTLFATWGFEYGFWAIWVPLFWALGYWLLSYLVASGRLDTFLAQEKVGTIHHFLGSRYKVKSLAVLAALASLIGISGPAMYEAHFVGNTVTRLIADCGNPANLEAFTSTYTPLLFGAFLAIAAVYMLAGGFTIIVRTDAIQLAIGYAVFSFVLSVLLYRMGRGDSFVPATAITCLLLLLSAFIVWFWLRTFGTDRRNLHWVVSVATLGGALVCYTAVLVLLVCLPSESKAEIMQFDAWSQFFKEQKVGLPLGMGVVMLINLMIANGLYQIADIGQWQRLASVQFDRSDPVKARAGIARSMRVVLVYSSVSWIVAILFGMSLRYAAAGVAADPYDALPIFLLDAQRAGSLLDRAIVLLMLLAFVAVMLSTLDSLVASVAFTVHNDWLVPLGERWKSVRVARIVVALLLVVPFVGYLWAVKHVSNFAEILYACWSMQIGLFWIVILSFGERRLPGWVAVLSLSAGMTGAVAPLIVGGPLSTYTHGAIFAFVASGLVAFLGLAFARRTPRVCG